MSNVVHLRQVIQVKRVRKFGHATVEIIYPDGSVRRRDKTLVVQFPGYATGAVSPGSLWQVSGRERLNQFYINDILITEYVIDAEEIKYLRPTGRIAARWLSRSVKGVGALIANRLVRLKHLDKLVEQRNTTALLAVPGMSNTIVERLFEQWPSESLHKTIEWLESNKLPLGLGKILVSIFDNNVVKEVQLNPFALMAMGVSYEKTMSYALELGFKLTDEPVIAGVALQAAVQHSVISGSTVIHSGELIRACEGLLGLSSARKAADISVKHGFLVRVTAGYQVYGHALMEASVAHFIVDTYQRASCSTPRIASWEKQLTRESVTARMKHYQLTLDFELSNEQCEAVVGALVEPISAISGGAGTGKTTILRAISEIFETLVEGIPCVTLALSGRAARRLEESTGRESKTIAKLVTDFSRDKYHFSEGALIIIDEASMVDLLSMYKLINILPPFVRLIFVGDSFQLPPVGHGLVYHHLHKTKIPFFELSTPKRHSEKSEINSFSKSVRNSIYTSPRKIEKTIKSSDSLLIEPNYSIERLIEIWSQVGDIGETIIISPIRGGTLGVDNININLQRLLGTNRKQLSYLDESEGWIPWVTESNTNLLEGDAVLVTENNYDPSADIRNGDLGVIKKVFDYPDNDGGLGVLEINNACIKIKANIIDKLQIGFAITIHKAQGSQWPVCLVVVPSDADGFVDSSLIYTAVTRSTKKLILLGNERLIARAITRKSKAQNRRVNIGEWMESFV